MFFDPRAVVLLIVLVAVSGWVARGLMASWFKLRRDDASVSSLSTMEERLKRIEDATSGLIAEVTAIREKERFMAKLQASASTREVQAKHETREGEPSPFVTQNIPVIPRVRS
jgi:hypothetical protein